LIFVLVLVTIIGLGVGPLLGVAFAGAKTTSVAQAVDNGFYAADGGIEYGIQTLRSGSPDCSLPVPITGPGTLNGRAVTVGATCTTLPDPSLLTAVITSVAGVGANGRIVTAVAKVTINTVDPGRGATVVSWSSVQS